MLDSAGARFWTVVLLIVTVVVSFALYLNNGQAIYVFAAGAGSMAAVIVGLLGD